MSPLLLPSLRGKERMEPGLRFRRDGLLTAVPPGGFYGNAADWRNLSAQPPIRPFRMKVKRGRQRLSGTCLLSR
ncbi:hypothetical protein GCWU000341_02709 [Oribacterium sp. oral taxon 078 str. F0262]|nr:hypothetical protein GCWU000341_02709 [Oribacterium sp. oral taxon 078 str. F0262]